MSPMITPDRPCAAPSFARAGAARGGGETFSLDGRIRALGDMLPGSTPAASALRLDLRDGGSLIHCLPQQVDLAVREAVSQAADLITAGGTIIVRTRLVGHHVYLIVSPRDRAAGAGRAKACRANADRYGEALRLAAASHGRARLRGPATLIVKLPAVLTLAARNRQIVKLPTFAPLKEMTHEDRQPIAV